MLDWIRRTIGGDRGARVRALVKAGFEVHQRGDLDGAAARYREALAIDPGDADALYLHGLVLGDGGRLDEAIASVRAAIAARPEESAFHYSLAGLLRRAGDPGAALPSLERALALDPQNPEWLNDLGNLRALRGETEAARDAYSRALALDARFAPAHYNLANLQAARGETGAAEAGYRAAVDADPRYVEAWNNLGNLLQRSGRIEEATTCYQRALALDAGYAEALNNLGIIAHAAGRFDEAIGHLEAALSARPDYADARANLGLVYQELGREREAADAYGAVLARERRDGVRVRLATLLPVIPDSVEAISAARARFDAEVTRLLDADLRIEDPYEEVGTCNFHLAYHGLSNRDLHAKVARVHERACPALAWAAPHALADRRRPGRVRVGFVSRFLHQHSIGKTTRGLLAGIDRDEFEVHALFAGPFVDDPISRFIVASADRHLRLPPTLAGAREVIAALELDVLFYQDIGMDAFTYFLAFARLAPVQCLSFGHPDTTGIANMDWFFSTEGFEPADADAHYSERLFRARGIATPAYYYRPTLPERPRTRRDFGLAEDAHLYVCAQTLFKFHPDIDALLAGILRGDPRGELVLVSGRNPEWPRLLEARFARTMPDVCDRVRFVPGMPEPDFLALLAACDVALDTIHFNGMNTNLECFSVGTPVVTLPKAFQRGRHTLAMYGAMGIDDGVARDEADYVARALALGTDPDRRADLSRRILDRCEVLYEDSGVPREFERFFREVLTATMR